MQTPAPTLSIALTRDIAVCRALRRVVFIDEQGVSEADELDDLDDQALHLLAVRDSRPVGSARLLVLGDMVKVGRVCVLADQRRLGLGAALMQAAVAVARGQSGVARVKLGAQTHALGFYARLGFVAFGAEFLDAGIPHRDMVLVL
jgi:ElaA protein